MRNRIIIGFFAILLLTVALNASDQNGEPENMSSESLEVLSPMYFDVEFGCRVDTTKVDIVWSMDTTGSMGGSMAGVRSSIGELVSELDALGIDYRFGGVTFGDRPVNFWDFDSLEDGLQMTSNATEFITRLNSTGVSGGGDWRECSIDAIAYSINQYDWRPGALHIIITYTDAPYHERGDGSGFSDYTDYEVYSLTMTTGTIVFFMQSCSDATASAFYSMLAVDSGGESYPLSTEWSTVFDDVLDLMGSRKSITARITNTGYEASSMIATLEPDDSTCFSIYSPNPINADTVEVGEDWIVSWGIEIDPTCFAPRRGFDIVMNSSHRMDRARACFHNDICECYRLRAHVMDDYRDIHSACGIPNMKWIIKAEDPMAEIDPSTIEVEFNLETFTYPDHLELEDSILTFTPPDTLEPSTASYNLINVETFDGYSLDHTIGTSARYDTIPPGLHSDAFPNPSFIFEDTMLVIMWHLEGSPLGSGINFDSLLIRLNADTITYFEEMTTYIGDGGEGTYYFTSSLSTYGISVYDSFTVCLDMQDLIPRSLCGPNDTTICSIYYPDTIPPTPPTANFYYPEDSDSICEPDEMIIEFTSADSAIIDSTVIININGYEYSLDEFDYSIFEDWYYGFDLPDSIFDDDTIECAIIAGIDSDSLEIEGLPIEMTFYQYCEPESVYATVCDITAEPCNTFAVPIYFSCTDSVLIEDFNLTIFSYEGYDIHIVGWTADSSIDSGLTGYLTPGMGPDGIGFAFFSGSTYLSSDTLMYLNFIVDCDAEPGTIEVVGCYFEFNSGTIPCPMSYGQILITERTPESWLTNITVHSTEYDYAAKSLIFGINPTATDGYDPGIDIESPVFTDSQVHAYFDITDSLYPAIENLDNDLKSPSTPQNWTILAELPGSEEASGCLTWDISEFPVGKFMLNSSFDMRTDTIYHFDYSSEDYRQFTIEWSMPEMDRDIVDFELGWNLVSLSILPYDNETESVFSFTPIDAYRYNPETANYEIPEYVSGNKGYWVFSMDDDRVTFFGYPIENYYLPVKRGWNMIGSVNWPISIVDLMLSDSISIIGDIYEFEYGEYITADSLHPGKGYWILVDGDGALYLP